MAKKEAKEAPEVDEDEIQEPVKPKKKSELGLVTIIGIIGGTIVFLVVLLYAVFWFGIRPYLAPQPAANPQEQVKNAHDAENSKKAKEEEEEEAGAHGSFNAHDPLAKFLVTGRITTNPKSSAQFIVIDLGIYSYYKDEEAKKTAEGGGGHGGSKDPTAMTPELSSRVKGIVNRILGSMTAEELQAKRDSLPNLFKKDLKPVFSENSFKLKEVVIQEFLIQ